tara:strand:- start:9 stop:377 length:369 start_codon:yes stop_codon:yes gene_type:complete
MAHYALLDMNNIVTKVISGRDEGDSDINWELYLQDIYKQICKRTSYNTKAGVHALDKKPFRKNYAAKGYVYDFSLDAFYSPKPFESWVLNKETCQWEPPVAKPTDNKLYEWNESSQKWDLTQ